MSNKKNRKNKNQDEVQDQELVDQNENQEEELEEGELDEEQLEELVDQHEENRKTKSSAAKKLAMTNAALEAQAKKLQQKTSQETKKVLDKEPKALFMIPLAIGESKGAYEECQINGHIYRIKKGEMIELPRSVALIVANYYQVQLNAGSDMLVTRDKAGLEDALA